MSTTKTELANELAGVSVIWHEVDEAVALELASSGKLLPEIVLFLVSHQLLLVELNWSTLISLIRALQAALFLYDTARHS